MWEMSIVSVPQHTCRHSGSWASSCLYFVAAWSFFSVFVLSSSYYGRNRKGMQDTVVAVGSDELVGVLQALAACGNKGANIIYLRSETLSDERNSKSIGWGFLGFSPLSLWYFEPGHETQMLLCVLWKAWNESDGALSVIWTVVFWFSDCFCLSKTSGYLIYDFASQIPKRTSFFYALPTHLTHLISHHTSHLLSPFNCRRITAKSRSIERYGHLIWGVSDFFVLFRWEVVALGSGSISLAGAPPGLKTGDRILSVCVLADLSLWFCS